MTTEKPVWDDVLAATAALPGCTLFRQNVGMGWVGDVAKQTREMIVLRNPRPLHAGLIKGSADGIGWQTIKITPEMVGREVAVFLSVETKAPKRGAMRTAQEDWRDNVQAAGGIAIVARSEEEFVGYLTGYIAAVGGFA